MLQLFLFALRTVGDILELNLCLNIQRGIECLLFDDLVDTDLVLFRH